MADYAVLGKLPAPMDKIIFDWLRERGGTGPRLTSHPGHAFGQSSNEGMSRGSVIRSPLRSARNFAAIS